MVSRARAQENRAVPGSTGCYDRVEDAIASVVRIPPDIVITISFAIDDKEMSLLR
jgi:hypothetical protein